MDREKKIEPIHIDDDMLTDPKLDELLKQDAIEEADRIEKELNSDPTLQGVGASDDMFDMIKARLKEQGVWEEEEKKQEDIYSQLSKEDREALELGKKVKKAKKQRKRLWKQLSAAAAIVLVLFCAGMSGEASRRWMLDAWDKLAYATGFNIPIDYVEDGTENLYTKSVEEEQAWQEIKDELNVPTLDFSYLPHGMVFDDFDVLIDVGQANVFYSFEGGLFRILIQTGNENESNYLQFDTGSKLVETVKNLQEIEIEIWDTTTGDIESYMATFEYKDCTFACTGMFSLQEIKKIMEKSTIN